MVIEREIGEKGQVVIPIDIRRYLGLKKGKKVIFEFKKNEVLIRSENAMKFLNEFLDTPKGKRRMITMKDIKSTLKEQYEIR